MILAQISTLQLQWGHSVREKTYPRRHESGLQRGGDTRSVVKNLQEFIQVT